jgi:competence protein ComEC
MHRAARSKPIGGVNSFLFMGKQVVLLDTTVRLLPGGYKGIIDLLVLSRSPRISIPAIAAAFTLKQVVIDASVPAWRGKLWQRECDSLHIPCFNVAEKGAFVMK